jgi:hypothetical protein
VDSGFAPSSTAPDALVIPLQDHLRRVLTRSRKAETDRPKSTLEWLRRQRRNAAQALRDLETGHRIEVDGVDVSAEWRSRYERLIERYERLIAKHEQRERETSLKQNIRFRE